MSSHNYSLIFTAYGSPGPENYGVFFVTLLVYIATLISNAAIMLVIWLDSALHKPMYIFLLNLAFNGLVGSSAVCPKIMENLIKDMKEISPEGCLLQVLAINIYACCVYAILAAMAYDRYVSICKPLQYHIIMTPNKVRILLAVAYLIPIICLSLQVFLTSKLPLCRYTIDKLFCDNLAFVNLSCAKSNVGNIYGLFLVFLLAIFPFISVILSYVRILMVSYRVSEKAQMTALKTCAPHLITFINFSSAVFFSVGYNRINYYMPKEINVLMSLHFILIPPLLHPVIYGINTQDIRKSMCKIIRRKVFSLTSEILKFRSPVTPDKRIFSCAA
ncbi:olfactory receptor 52E4-like [Denticeps clupeoides]|uniref:G-protein coupled receptors family 1 profile domain-containing protein n=1 Tax=Denticeps clupeoides TaxID=299321 RepID=A0A8C4A9X7_9TELE|nr:olfactory receptor 52E4-like [Denticeps clupeoides]XP_028821598.1 olfactory receptor 52E4-like [Denticeps clupeoides]